MTDAHCFSFPEIDAMPPSIRVPLQVLWHAAAMALRQCLARFGAPECARASAWVAAHRPLREMLMLRRAQKILRCVLFICARYFGLTAVFKPSRKSTFRHHAPRAIDENDPATWSVAFLMPPRMRPLVHATNAAQPLHFQTQNRNPMRVLARRMEGLRRVLAAPMRHVRRIARALTREAFVAEQPPKRRKPPADRRDLWEELEDGRHRLWWAFSGDNPRFDSS